MYPIEKYKYFTTKTKDGRDKVIAISTYAGRTVRGSAICDTNDTFSMENGKELAAARCAEKIAQKRVNRARAKLAEAAKMVAQADDFFIRMDNYLEDAENELIMAQSHLGKVMESL